MKNENVVVKKDVVIKQNCHSRGFLSGIYNACRYHKKEKTLLNRCVEAPRVLRTVKSGMTPLFNNGGFTLIELLVVVLIIGILAAVAVPQYQKAVIKSRAGAILSLGASIASAEETYYLAHGNYAEFDLLDLDIPKECTPVEDPNTLNSYACGKYFNFYLDPDGSVNSNYCPNRNTSRVDCKDTREFHLAFRLHHYRYSSERNQRRCSVYNDSKLGKTICAGLTGAGFVCGSGC